MRLSRIPGQRRVAAVLGSAVLLASLALAGAPALPAAALITAASTLYVAPSGSGGGSCSTPAYNTIQAAVAAATAGDTVFVCPGTYVETGQIVIGKNLSIAGADKATTIIKPAQDTSAAYKDDSSAWILVDAGVTFGLSGVTLDGTGRLVTNAIISHGHGLINGNIFTNIAYNESGPDYSGAGIALYGSDMTVSDNVFGAIGREGVFAAFQSAATITGNVYTGKGAGNWLDYGIEVGRSSTAVISGNTITGNTGVATADGSTSAGVLVSSYFDGSGPTSGATITGNTITGNTDGIEVGFDQADVAAVSAHHNVLSGNVHGVLSTHPTVDATDNWWGCNLGPGTSGCAGVSGNVTFNPWLVLRVDAPFSILPGATSTATGDVTHDSLGRDTSASGHIPDGTTIGFSASAGIVSPATRATVNGRAEVAFRAPWAPGQILVSATLDDQTVSTPVLVLHPEPTAPPFPTSSPSAPPSPSPSPSPAPIPTPAPTPVTVAIAAVSSSDVSGPFTTPTKILRRGQSITLRFTTSPALAGTRLGVWIAIKGPDGTWSAYAPHASVTTDAGGVATYRYTTSSKVWLAFRARYSGSSMYAPAWSYPSQFGRWR